MKKKDSKCNEVIIIGGDHHNTLALVRNISKKGIKNKVLIHDECTNINNIMIRYSRYTKQLDIVKEEEKEIIEYLIKNKINGYKQILIVGSDYAEYILDKNFILLNNYYFIPGFKNRPGMVCKMMDKFEQKKWAEKNNILMAKSWNLKRKNNKFEIPLDLKIPCIIKPNISAFGSKADIKICYSLEEVETNISFFEKNNYNDIIVQEFLKKKYEICALGCIINSDKKIFGGVIKKIKENPPKGGGSLTFAKFIDEPIINEKVNAVLNCLIKEKYIGMYDIEFLVCDNDIYLNEINFRHSGNGYALTKNNLDIPYLCYLDYKNENIPSKYIRKKPKGYLIDEINELMLVRNKYISIFQFLFDFFKAKSKAKFEIYDLKVMIFEIFLKKRGKKQDEK